MKPIETGKTERIVTPTPASENEAIAPQGPTDEKLVASNDKLNDARKLFSFPVRGEIDAEFDKNKNGRIDFEELEQMDWVDLPRYVGEALDNKYNTYEEMCMIINKLPLEKAGFVFRVLGLFSGQPKLLIEFDKMYHKKFLEVLAKENGYEPIMLFPEPRRTELKEELKKYLPVKFTDDGWTIGKPGEKSEDFDIAYDDSGLCNLIRKGSAETPAMEAVNVKVGDGKTTTTTVNTGEQVEVGPAGTTKKKLDKLQILNTIWWNRMAFPDLSDSKMEIGGKDEKYIMLNLEDKSIIKYNITKDKYTVIQGKTEKTASEKEISLIKAEARKVYDANKDSIIMKLIYEIMTTK